MLHGAAPADLPCEHHVQRVPRQQRSTAVGTAYKVLHASPSFSEHHAQQEPQLQRGALRGGTACIGTAHLPLPIFPVSTTLSRSPSSGVVP